MTNTRTRSLIISALAILVLLFVTPHGNADDTTAAPANPLEPLARLIGGEWHSADNYHIFEWGLGKLSVTSKSYFVIEGKPKQVSDGMWYWHPGVGTIKAIATAIDMGVPLWEYTTTFEGNTMRNDLTTHTDDGKADTYVETWEFTDDNTYVWSLLKETDEGMQKIMGSTYTRK
jgi:hypothetical protein